MATRRRTLPTASHSRSRPRVVIVGAGFAGIAAAQHLDGRYDVTVIDRSPWFEWLPNIHELLSGVKRPADLRLQRTRLVKRAGRRFPFDACIVAVGGVDETFGVPGADRHALSFKGVDGCAEIGRRLAQLASGKGPAS